MMLHSDDFQSQVLRDLDRELQDGGVHCFGGVYCHHSQPYKMGGIGHQERSWVQHCTVQGRVVYNTVLYSSPTTNKKEVNCHPFIII